MNALMKRTWRAGRREDGFALVTAMLIMTVMSMLMVLTLANGVSVNNISEHRNRWTRVLGTAEGGLDAAISKLSVDRGSTSDCDIGTNDTCPSSFGEYQVSWSSSGSITTVNSIGYYPSRTTSNAVTREVQARFEPVPSFRYALYSDSSLQIKNGSVIIGDIFANQNVDTGNTSTICGSITSSGGGITVGQGTQVENAGTNGCVSGSGDVWAGGSISLANQVDVWGNATASGPLDCGFSISGTGLVHGTTTSCGTPLPATETAAATHTDLPAFSWYAGDYPGLICFPSTGACGPTNTSPTAVDDFNMYSGGSGGNIHSGNYAIWQTGVGGTSTAVDLGDLNDLTGDLTIVTNARIDLGNTQEITLASGTTAANLVIVSLYFEDGGPACNLVNGDNCSIWGKNSVKFDPGTSDPDDGIVGLLYTWGAMGFNNQGNEGEGALYANSMDIKNGFDVTYNSRIERILGFGDGLERTLWLEIDI